jgi:hypothetical protein
MGRSLSSQRASWDAPCPASDASSGVSTWEYRCQHWKYWCQDWQLPGGCTECVHPARALPVQQAARLQHARARMHAVRAAAPESAPHHPALDALYTVATSTRSSDVHTRTQMNTCSSAVPLSQAACPPHQAVAHPPAVHPREVVSNSTSLPCQSAHHQVCRTPHTYTQ